MKKYIIVFILVLCITPVFGGSRNAKTYSGVGVTNAKIDESDAISALKQESMVGEIIFVDMDREYRGYARVVDAKTNSQPDFPVLGAH
mgnify:CR=1 FL=1